MQGVQAWTDGNGRGVVLEAQSSVSASILLIGSCQPDGPLRFGLNREKLSIPHPTTQTTPTPGPNATQEPTAMRLPRFPTLSAALCVAAMSSWTPLASAHDGPDGHHHQNATARAAREMAQAATNLWTSLTPEQQKKAGFAFKNDQRYDWHFIPKVRQGLSWKNMDGAQKALATGLLSTGMSQRGFLKAQTIMSLEEILREMEKGKVGTPVRDPEQYFYSIFGDPSDSKSPWGWRVEGHHLSLNFTVVGEKGIAGGPIFMGTNPAEVRQGPRKGLRVLGDEEELARKLVKSLSDDQKKKALVASEAPKDIISFVVRKANPLEPAGLLAADMNAEQKALLTHLIASYSERLRPEISAQDLAKILKAGGVDKVGFAWAGGLDRGQPHYYRLQGPTFLVEYDNTQNEANHVHSVWRDFDGDFGEDLLKAHYANAPNGHGHDAEKK
ncbi:MAG: hypothetical protein JWN86_3991 [Planctomycetota bacterium]|nr:hypothetical protein [Planctomycetota bacterium]